MKTVRIKTGPWRDVVKSCQRIRFVEYYILYGGIWNLFSRAGHDLCVLNLLRSIRRRNPPCNAKDNLRVRLIVIEAWFRGYLGSLGSGGPWTAGLYTYAGLLDYEDTRLKTPSRVRVGLSFAWKASLTIWIFRFPSL